MSIDDDREWLEADGLGGFASGTASGVRTRRYHALLLSATTPPTGRMVLVNGLDAWIDIGASSYALTSQRYAPDVLYPDGATRIISFSHRPWPTWDFELPDGTRVRQEIVAEHGTGTIAVSYRIMNASSAATLRVRPFFSGRDYHALMHRNYAFRFDPVASGARRTFAPYAGVVPVVVDSNGDYTPGPDWYLNFMYRLEAKRGLDCVEDLATPGEWRFMLQAESANLACLLLSSSVDSNTAPTKGEVESRCEQILIRERDRRAALGGPLQQAADSYIVARAKGRTIVAGYPWFTDWGRDTFIALRGLCLAGSRTADARDMLLEWAGTVSEGMLPNRFPDSGEQAEYNSVDASLWFVVAAYELIQTVERTKASLTRAQRRALTAAIADILHGYTAGTRFGIRADADGLLACGVSGSQLTWMDARVNDRPITPRIGKPVEIQALWINALMIAEHLGIPSPDSKSARLAFTDRFWNETTGMLADVVDIDHVPNTRDDSCRPNQILAVGGLPESLLDLDKATRVVEVVEQHLLTPIGLRTLAREDPRYAPVYDGAPWQRDAVYHQGTVWPWLLGPFVEAWLRVRGSTTEARQEARRRFFEPLCAHLDLAGLGHVSEIADGDAPHTPRGCPFQAWSLGEMMRIDLMTR